MNLSNTTKFMKGMATGLVVGASVTMMLDPISDRKHKKLSKKATGVFKNVGDIVDTVVSMMK